MANKEIFDINNQILGKYLPQAPAPHPYVENPMASNLDAGGFNINDISEVAFDAHSSITASTTELKLVNSNPAGCIVEVSDGTNSGQVYDTYFNQPLISYNAQTVLQVDKGDSHPFSASGKITQVQYTTGASSNPSWIFLPTPGTLNETYGALFSNIGGANTDAVDICYGVPTPTPSILTTVTPSTDTNKVYWFVNVGVDNWVWFN